MALAAIVAGCGEGGESSSTMGGEFGTLQECLQSIRAASGMSLNILTDKPSQVSGTISNPQGFQGFFSCDRRATGSKGTYYEGTFTQTNRESANIPAPATVPVPVTVPEPINKSDPVTIPQLINEPDRVTTSESVATASPTPSVADELRKLDKLREEGLLSDEEFQSTRKLLLK